MSLGFADDRLSETDVRTVAKYDFPRPVTLKDLRHTYGTLMVNEVNCPLPIVQVQMGHADIKTTMQYIQPSTARPHVTKFAALIAPELKSKKSRPS